MALLVNCTEHFTVILPIWGLPQVLLSGKKEESACNKRCRDIRGCDPWVRNIPRREEMAASPLFLPGKSTWTKKPGRL